MPHQALGNDGCMRVLDSGFMVAAHATAREMNETNDGLPDLLIAVGAGTRMMQRSCIERNTMLIRVGKTQRIHCVLLMCGHRRWPLERLINEHDCRVEQPRRQLTISVGC
eukprot:m.185775 g.185775  ORF g.185775 m.185775 type:complete len:110 (+) comp16916_c0_seq15:181-510(+)